jgi:hypothetical protein
MELFITYAHEDIEKVRKVAELLTTGGHTVWFDNQLLPGQDWKEQLNNAIARCDAYVYALTKGAVTSEWCEWEFATAVRLGKAVLPILLEAGVAIPQQLQKLQYADFQHEATALATAKVFAALGAMQKIPVSQSPPLPANPKGMPSRAWNEYGHWTDVLVVSAHKPRNDVEEIQGKFSAKVGDIGGRLIITNQRLLWEPSKINLPWRVASQPPLDIPLSDIRDVRGFETDFAFFAVYSRSNQSAYIFQIVPWYRKRIIESIERQRSLAHPELPYPSAY